MQSSLLVAPPHTGCCHNTDSLSGGWRSTVSSPTETPSCVTLLHLATVIFAEPTPGFQHSSPNSRTGRSGLCRPPKGSKTWNPPNINPLLLWGNYGIIKGFHFWDPLGGSEFLILDSTEAHPLAGLRWADAAASARAGSHIGIC